MKIYMVVCIEQCDDMFDEEGNLNDRLFVGIFLNRLDAEETVLTAPYEGAYRLVEVEEG